MRLLDINAVAYLTSYAKSTIFMYQREGKFPQSKKSGTTSRWDSDVVETWMILAFKLKRPLPKIDEEDMQEVVACVQKLQTPLSITQAV